MSSEPVRIAGIPTETGSMRHDIPVDPTAPGETAFIIVNSGMAMVIKTDEEGRITTETTPLIEAVEAIEALIAKIRATGAVEASAANRDARQATNVIGMASSSARDR